MAEERFDLIVRAKDEASRHLGSVTKSIVGMVAAYGTISTAVGFLRDSVTAAIESEKVWNDLGASIQRHGGDWSQLKKVMMDATAALQTQTGLSDEALARSAQVFIDYGSNAKRSMDLVKVAADLAAGANMSLASATDLIAKASVGYTSTLSRYGIILDETTPKAEKFEKALELIDARYGGAAAARMDTTAQKLVLLSERYGDLQEVIGGAIIAQTSFNDRLDDANSALDYLTLALGEASPAANDLEGQLKLLEIQTGQAETKFDKFRIALGFAEGAVASFKLAIGGLWGLISLIGDTVDSANTDLKQQAEQLRLLIEITGNFDEAIQMLYERAHGFGEEGPMSSFRDDVQKTEDTLRKAKTEFESFQEVMEYDTFAGEGGMPSKYSKIVDDLAEISPTLNEVSADMQRFAEDTRDVLASNLGDGISDIFLGFTDLRTGLQDIFKGIAEDFIRMVINAIMNAMATRLVSSLFNIALPGSGGVPGLFGLGKPSFAGPTGASVSTPGMAASAGNVTINLNGPIIGEEQYIRHVFVPILERDARLNMNKLALRV